MEGGSYKSVIIIMDNKVPEFAIFQNSKTRQSAIWTKNRWVDAQEGEFDALWTLAQIIRSSPNAKLVLEQMVDQIKEIQDEGDAERE